MVREPCPGHAHCVEGKGEERRKKTEKGEERGESRERGADEWPCACKKATAGVPSCLRGGWVWVGAPAINLVKFGEKRVFRV